MLICTRRLDTLQVYKCDTVFRVLRTHRNNALQLKRTITSRRMISRAYWDRGSR